MPLLPLLLQVFQHLLTVYRADNQNVGCCFAAYFFIKNLSKKKPGRISYLPGFLY